MSMISSSVHVDENSFNIFKSLAEYFPLYFWKKSLVIYTATNKYQILIKLILS